MVWPGTVSCSLTVEFRYCAKLWTRVEFGFSYTYWYVKLNMTPVLMGPCRTCWYLTGIELMPLVRYEEFRSVLEKPSRTILMVRETTLDAATAPGEVD